MNPAFEDAEDAARGANVRQRLLHGLGFGVKGLSGLGVYGLSGVGV